nr:hypothetical protein WS71_13565 [Burkholderia mayonis]
MAAARRRMSNRVETKCAEAIASALRRFVARNAIAPERIRCLMSMLMLMLMLMLMSSVERRASSVEHRASSIAERAP